MAFSPRDRLIFMSRKDCVCLLLDLPQACPFWLLVGCVFVENGVVV